VGGGGAGPPPPPPPPPPQPRQCSFIVGTQVWVGGRRDTDWGSGWGEHLRTTGPGPHTTLDLTHVRHIRLYNLVAWTIKILNVNKSHNSKVLSIDGAYQQLVDSR
jgi:hypothetical protein